MKEREFSSALWSLDPNSDFQIEAIPGQLSFDGTSYFQLDIPVGVLLDYPKTPTAEGYMQRHTVGGLHADCAYGFSQTGDYFLLKDITTPGPCFAAPGFQRQSLTGATLLVSKQRIGSNPRVKSIAVRIPGLREWAGLVPFTVSYKMAGNKPKGPTFNCAFEDVENLMLYEDEQVRVFISFTFKREGGRTPSFSFSFETDCEINIVHKQQGCDFESTLVQYAFPIVDFMAFCMGFRKTITSIKFMTEEGVSGEYLAPFVGASDELKNVELDRMPLPYKRIRGKISNMIANWFSFDEYAKSSSALITSLMHNWEMPLDMRFLASAQAFEAASRSRVDEQEITDEALQEKIEAINKSNMTSKLRQWVVYKVGNAKWKTANSLADNLINKLGDIPPYIVPDTSRYLEDHRRHRDAYTHRKNLSTEQQLSSVDLHTHAEATQLLTYGAIALFLGIEPEEFVSALKESKYRWNSIYRANRLYALRPDVNDDRGSNT